MFHKLYFIVLISFNLRSIFAARVLNFDEKGNMINEVSEKPMDFLRLVASKVKGEEKEGKNLNFLYKFEIFVILSSFLSFRNPFLADPEVSFRNSDAYG